MSQNCFGMSVCPSAWNNSTPTGRILTKFDIWAFFANLSRKFKFHEKPTKITGTLHEDVFTFITISSWILLRMRNVVDRCCRENQNILCSVTFFWKSRRSWDNVEKYGGARGHRCHNMAHTYCMLEKQGYTHTRACTRKYVILIAFPRQQWFANTHQC